MMIQTPLPPDYRIGVAQDELNAQGLLQDAIIPITEALSELTEHESADSHARIVLDWAFQIAFLEKMPLGNAIHAAMILYYG